jgi:dihydrofolate reductase
MGKNFPLRNRPCAIFTSNPDPIVYINNIFVDQYSDFSDWIRTGRFDKIFICGGASVYKQALEQNLVDVIHKTILPDGFAKGDKFLDKKTIAMMNRPNFQVKDSLEYTLLEDKSAYYLDRIDGNEFDSQFHGGNGTDLPVKPTDTLFPWIRFEILHRTIQNQRK